MKIDVPLILHEPLDKEYFMTLYEDHHQVRIAVKVARNVYLRTRVAEAQNWRCCWCGVECDARRGRKTSATVEHVVPKSQGGADEWENMALACSDCNGKRGVQDMSEFDPRNYVKVKSKQQWKKSARVEHYLKRGRKFAAMDWKVSERVQCMEDWLRSLHPHLNEEIRAKLVDALAV